MIGLDNIFKNITFADLFCFLIKTETKIKFGFSTSFQCGNFSKVLKNIEIRYDLLKGAMLLCTQNRWIVLI